MGLEDKDPLVYFFPLLHVLGQSIPPLPAAFPLQVCEYSLSCYGFCHNNADEQQF